MAKLSTALPVSGVEAESFESWYSWFLSFLPQWFMIPTIIFFQIHYSRRLLIIYWLNDFLSGNLVPFCIVSSAFRLLLHPDSISSFALWNAISCIPWIELTQLIYTCILLSFSQCLVISDSRAEVQRFMIPKLKQRLMILTGFVLIMIHDSWFRFHAPPILVRSFSALSHLRCQRKRRQGHPTRI